MGHSVPRQLKKADLHLHSSFSCDVPNLPELSPRALYDKAVALGMGFFTLTDHDTMKGIAALARALAEEFGDAPPIPLIPGVEMKVRDPKIGHTVHINVLGLTLTQMRQLGRRRHSMTAFLQYCRAEGLYHAYNHPFWFERHERGDLATILRLMEAFPVVELNAGRIPQLNDRTATLARRCGRPLVAGSDSHTGQVGRAYTIASGDTPAEFLASILHGAALVVPDHMVFSGFMREIAEMIDLVFLNRAAFRLKRTLLCEAPLARLLARAFLGSHRMMRQMLLKRIIRAMVRCAAYAPAYIFIWQQKRMNLQLAKADAQLAELLSAAPRLIEPMVIEHDEATAA